MRLILAVLLTSITPNIVAASEFSVRCQGTPPAMPYFATFDTDTKRVIFESAPLSPTQPDGGNVFPGEIHDTDDASAGQIHFTLRLLVSSRDLLSFWYDSNRNEMLWPGLDDRYRQTLQHSCIVTPPRSILSFRSPNPVVHPVSLRCEHTGYVYLTFDPDSKEAVWERGGQGMMYVGKVMSAQDDRVDLLMDWRGSSGQLSWNKGSQTITFDTVGSDGRRSTNSLPCEEIAPRTMIEYYKILRR